MAKRLLLIGLSVFLVVSPLTALAVDIPAKIYENGVNNTPIAVPGVNVEVFGGYGFKVLFSTAVSGSDGGCLLGNIPLGKEVIVKLTKDGYTAQYDVRSYSEMDVENGVILWIGSEANVASLYKNLGEVFDVKKGQVYLGIENELTGEGIEGIQLVVSSGKVFDLGHGEYLITNAGGVSLNVGIQKPGNAFDIESVAIPLFSGAMTQYYVDIRPNGGVADSRGSLEALALFDPTTFAGTWTGQGTDDTFHTSATVSMSVSINPTTQTFEVTFTLVGTLFGLPAPPPQTFSGSYTVSSGTTTINATSPVLGNLTITISPTGALSGSLTSLPVSIPFVSRVDFTGTVTQQVITVNITTHLTAGGTSSGGLTLNHTVSVNMSIAPTSIEFGSVTTEQSSDKTTTITNLSSSTTNLTGTIGPLVAPFSVVTGGGAFNLAPGQSQTVTVRFSPTAAGTASANLPITHNATNQTSPTTIPLSGTGVSASHVINISITPASVSFGNVTVDQSSTQNITFTNQTTSTAALTGSVGTLAAPFSVVTGGGAFSLAPGQSQTVTVRFSPTTAGPASANLSITHNATNQTSPSNISLAGTGVTPGGANVVISLIAGPGTGTPGGKIAIQNTVTNQGTQTASKITVNFYLSTDTQIETADTLIGKRKISNLTAGASSGPVSTMVTIPRNTAPGSYFIGGIVGNNTNIDSDGITICLSLSKPKLLLPKNKGKNISTTPTLTWSSIAGASTYEVQVATDSGFTNVVASMTGLTNTQWTVSPALTSGTTYFWRVRAVNPCGPGPFSTTSRFEAS